MILNNLQGFAYKFGNYDPSVDDSILFEVEYHFIDVLLDGSVTNGVFICEQSDGVDVTINELEVKEIDTPTYLVRDGLEEPVLKFDSIFITDTSNVFASG